MINTYFAVLQETLDWHGKRLLMLWDLIWYNVVERDMK